MEDIALRFTDEPYAEETVREFIDGFQSKGYAVLPNVFDRDSVDGYLAQLRDAVRFDGIQYVMPDDSPLHVWAAQAPRVRQILAPALTHSVAPGIPAMCNSMWIITPHDCPEMTISWHKDREPDGMPGNDYHYPIDVFVGFYFEDLDEERGPLNVIPGSHWDSRITPYTGEPHDVVLCNKEDAVLLDQRVWHCGTPRAIPGLRILVVHAYYLAPVHYGHVPPMPRSQHALWMRHKGRRSDQAFWGGPLAPPIEEE